MVHDVGYPKEFDMPRLDKRGVNVINFKGLVYVRNVF